MHINLKIEKPALSSDNSCTTKYNYWQCFPGTDIEMQELKLHEFWENRIF